MEERILASILAERPQKILISLLTCKKYVCIISSNIKSDDCEIVAGEHIGLLESRRMVQGGKVRPVNTRKQLATKSIHMLVGRHGFAR